MVDSDVVLDFAKSTWIPEVLQIYHPSSNVIAEYFSGLQVRIQHFEVYEVY